MVDGKSFRLADEVGYIQRRAAAHDSRIVSIGELVLFSRESGDCAFSKHYPPENYVIGALSDTLKLMAGWVLGWLSAVRARLRQRLDLLVEFIALRHQLAVLQRTGTRRPCFRPSERLFWVFLSRWWANWQSGLIIVQPATVLRWRRRGFWAIWGSGSCRRWRGGRPRIRCEVSQCLSRPVQLYMGSSITGRSPYLRSWIRR